MVFKDLCILVVRGKVASALKGLRLRISAAAVVVTLPERTGRSVGALARGAQPGVSARRRAGGCGGRSQALPPHLLDDPLPRKHNTAQSNRENKDRRIPWTTRSLENTGHHIKWMNVKCEISWLGHIGVPQIYLCLSTREIKFRYR